MAIELYVDSLNKAETLGITANESSVSYNLELLSRFNSAASGVFTAGRYFCIVWETSPASITFVDILKNPDVVNTIIKEPKVRNSFLKKLNFNLKLNIQTYKQKKKKLK